MLDEGEQAASFGVCSELCLKQRTSKRRCTSFRFDSSRRVCDSLWFDYNCHKPAATYIRGTPPNLPPTVVNWWGYDLVHHQFQQVTLLADCDVWGLPPGMEELAGRYVYIPENGAYSGPGGSVFKDDVMSWTLGYRNGTEALTCNRVSPPERWGELPSCSFHEVSGGATRLRQAENLTIMCDVPAEILDPDRKGSWYMGLSFEIFEHCLLLALFWIPPMLAGFHREPDRRASAFLAGGTFGFWYICWVLLLAWSPLLHTDFWLVNTVLVVGLCLVATAYALWPVHIWVISYGRIAPRSVRQGFAALAAVTDPRGLRLASFEVALKANADLATRWRGRTVWHMAREKLSPSDERLAMEAIQRLRAHEADWLRLEAHDVEGFEARLRERGLSVPEVDFTEEGGAAEGGRSATGRSELHCLVISGSTDKLCLQFGCYIDCIGEGGSSDEAAGIKEVTARQSTIQDPSLVGALLTPADSNSANKLAIKVERLNIPDTTDSDCAPLGEKCFVVARLGSDDSRDRSHRATLKAAQTALMRLLEEMATVGSPGVLLVAWSDVFEAYASSPDVRNAIIRAPFPVLIADLEDQLQMFQAGGRTYECSPASWNWDLSSSASRADLPLVCSEEKCEGAFVMLSRLNRKSLRTQACQAAQAGAVALIVCSTQGAKRGDEGSDKSFCHYCLWKSAEPTIPVWFVAGPRAEALWRAGSPANPTLPSAVELCVSLPVGQPMDWLFGEAGGSNVWLQLVRTLAQRAVKEGVTVNAVDDQGNTPLHLAAWHGDHRSTAELVRLGADRGAVNALALTPCQLCLSSLDDNQRRPAEDYVYQKEEEPEGTCSSRLFGRFTHICMQVAPKAGLFLAFPFFLCGCVLALPLAPCLFWRHRDAMSEEWRGKKAAALRLLRGQASVPVQKTLAYLKGDFCFEDIYAVATSEPKEDEWSSAAVGNSEEEDNRELARARRLMTMAFGDACEGRSDFSQDNLQLRSVLSDEEAASRAGTQHPHVSRLQVDIVLITWIYFALLITWLLIIEDNLRVAIGMKGISLIIVLAVVLPLGLHLYLQEHHFLFWLWRGRRELARKRVVVSALIAHAKVLLRLAGEQRLHHEAKGPKYRRWLRYLLEALVPLDSSGELRDAAIRADASVSAAYQALFDQAQNATLKDASIPRSSLVNSAQNWQEAHQVHAHGPAGPSGLRERDVVRFASTLLEVGAFSCVADLCAWAAKECSETGESFFREGYNRWLLECAKRADSWLEEQMVLRFGRFGEEGGKYKRAPLKLLERVRVKTRSRRRCVDDLDEAMASGVTCDLSRCSLTFETADELREVYEKMCTWTMEETGMEPVRVSWHYRDQTPGYKDAKLLLLVPVPGTQIRHIVECQFLLRAALDIKVHSHLIYQVTRGDLCPAPVPRAQETFLSRLRQCFRRREGARAPLLQDGMDEDEEAPTATERPLQPTLYGAQPRSGSSHHEDEACCPSV
eukprot:TRINITY_DN32833_c0_g1_i1.p1 TRINITY_DN32833_c0_g1~~TRINITY_DN32833_c0_g1_i1.p1  ORF type:complete len:1557 (+),score=243.85 TRINITY_DN32833_c0_g1_i1:274-4671(+)